MNRRHGIPSLLSGLLLLSAGVAEAQTASSPTATTSAATWPSRLGVSVRGGEFRLAGNSEAFRLFDQALTAGTAQLAPRVAGAEVQVRVWRALSAVAGAETGNRTAASISRVAPTASSTPVAQRTSFELSSVQHAGVQWQAWQWQRSERSVERLRVVLGGGLGQARYALRQWGNFVDATRRVEFSDDLQSNGRGTFRYLAAKVEVPVSRRLAMQGDVRHHSGSASMNGDFATFDRLDLGGMRLGLGVVVTPWR
ncbi:hypothetical protein [Gemmatimonas phototrophica]|uniref:Outer membrane protein beta-barrel domain-containing protein n=1 Tax=Gemmatimonas phototrophica TaxID=1379270 RepID=A0A143BLT6_9BACT|nr:hypothetical protein [Gemmatimonas phototrophica]AMW06007.1 hypothetical protein GEMMAAP_16850 [Gemmatimonas phototrophica]